MTGVPTQLGCPDCGAHAIELRRTKRKNTPIYYCNNCNGWFLPTRGDSIRPLWRKQPPSVQRTPVIQEGGWCSRLGRWRQNLLSRFRDRKPE